MCFEKPRLWWLLETHVAFRCVRCVIGLLVLRLLEGRAARRLLRVLTRGDVTQGRANRAAVQEVPGQLLTVGRGVEPSPVPLLQLERELRNQAVNIRVLQREGALAAVGEHHLHLPLGGILRVRLNRVRVVREHSERPERRVLAGLRR